LFSRWFIYLYNFYFL